MRWKDEQISSLEAEMELIRYEQKKMARKMTANRQRMAELRNELKRLKEERKKVGA